MNKKIYDSQFSSFGAVYEGRNNHSIYVVIAKPTRVCNADCSYCSSPPLSEMGQDWEPEWSMEKFKKYFDKVYPMMGDESYWIWHGGEPMLMQPDFYIKAYEYVQEKVRVHGRRVYFSMQSNLLGYNEKWKKVFEEVFYGSVSTSFDPDEKQRTIKGNPQTYSRVFKRAYQKVLDDGFRPLIIGVYDEQKAPLMHDMYDWSLSMGEKSFPLRFNYCHPTGRFESGGEVIKPETYGKYLIEIFDRWIKDNPNFIVTPLDQMFKKVIGIDGEGHCPWTRKCGGRFIGIEPNGDVYNCTDFADMGNEFCFGNLETDSMIDIMASKPATYIKRRSVQVPLSCRECEHFDDCEGGCARDAALYEHGLYGKFHYCKSWKMVFARIKEAIINGEADKLIERYGYSPESVKAIVRGEIKNHFGQYNLEIDFEDISINGFKSVYGAGENLLNKKDIFYDKNGQFNKQEEDEPFANDPMFKIDKLSKINRKLKEIKLKVYYE